MGELQRRLDAEGVPITALVVHPGTVNTGTSAVRLQIPNINVDFILLHLHLEGLSHGTPSWFIWIASTIAITPLQGAFTPLFAATSAEVAAAREKYKGAFLTPYGKITTVTKEARDPVLAKTLWETSERVIRDALQKHAD